MGGGGVLRLSTFEDVCGAAMAQRFQASRLENGAVRTEIALENGQAAVGRDRCVETVDDLAIGVWGGGEFLGESAAGNSERIAMETAATQQLAQHYRGATYFVDVASEISATGLQVADQRRAGKNNGDVVYVERDARLVGDGGDVQDGIGGTASRSHHCAGILECLSGDDVAGKGGTAQHSLGDGAAGTTVEGGALGEHGRDHRAAEQGEADRLGNHAHGVGGELAGARAGGREAGAGEVFELGALQAAGKNAANRLVGVDNVDVTAGDAAG
jgi:hypothetical protein